MKINEIVITVNYLTAYTKVRQKNKGLWSFLIYWCWGFKM